jgi:hypothetical protein
MPTLNIDGVGRVKVDDSFLSLSPEEQAKTVDEIAAQLGSAKPTVSETPKPQAKEPDTSTFDSLTAGAEQGIFLGATDEITSGLLTPVEMVKGAITGEDRGKGFLERAGSSYNRLMDFQRDKLRSAQESHPVAYGVGEVTGGAVAGGGLAKGGATLAGRATTLPGKVGAGIAEGAGYGGVYGFNTGDGLDDRLRGAASGAVAGGAIGGAVPATGAVLGAIAKPVRDAVHARVSPKGYAQQKVAERLAAGGMTPTQAGQRIADAQTRGTSLSLADTGGKSARSLLRTATNIPGPAQDRVTTQLNLRAMQQGDKLKTLVRDTFADPDGFITAKDKLATAMKAKADPLYTKAYQKSVPMTPEIAELLNRPAGKAALKRAIELAKNEGIDLQGAPNTLVLDYTKRGFDDMVKGQTDLAGKVTNEGRIFNNLKNQLRDHVARWNPDYKKALSIWSEGSGINDALDWGRTKAAGLSPEAVQKALGGMSEAEKKAARIGFADHLRQQIDRAGFTHNAILRIFSNRQNAGVLRELFDNPSQFSEFRKTIFDMARQRSTYEAVKGNSTTVRQALDVADAGGLNETVGLVATTAREGPISAGIQFIATRLKMLGGLTPKVADEIAKTLMERDPQAVQQVSQHLGRIAQQNLTAEQRRQAVGAVLRTILPMQAVSAGRTGSAPSSP